MLDLIRCSKTYVGKSDMTSGNKYRIRLSRKDKQGSITFNFHDNYLNQASKNDLICAILVDSDSYTSCRDINDFMSCFGYIDYKESNKVYNACRKQHEKLLRLFNEYELEKLHENLMDIGY